MSNDRLIYSVLIGFALIVAIFGVVWSPSQATIIVGIATIVVGQGMVLLQGVKVAERVATAASREAVADTKRDQLIATTTKTLHLVNSAMATQLLLYAEARKIIADRSGEKGDQDLYMKAMDAYVQHMSGQARADADKPMVVEIQSILPQAVDQIKDAVEGQK